MSAISEVLTISNTTDILCGDCSSSEEEPRRKKLKFRPKALTEKISKLQNSLTQLAFKPCCSKYCLKNNFKKNNDQNEFDFSEAKVCFDQYFLSYQSKSKEEYNQWIYNNFLGTCYGLDEGGKIIVIGVRQLSHDMVGCI